MKVTTGKERSNNHIQRNHCVVDYLLCPLFCATQNLEPHWEVQSARGSWSVCMVCIPVEQPLSRTVYFREVSNTSREPKWQTVPNAPLGVKHMFFNIS